MRWLVIVMAIFGLAHSAHAHGACRLAVTNSMSGPATRIVNYAKACEAIDARIELGPTGTLAAETLTKLRYVFSEKIGSSKPPDSSQQGAAMNSPLALEYRAVQIVDMAIFPAESITLTPVSDQREEVYRLLPYR